MNKRQRKKAWKKRAYIPYGYSVKWIGHINVLLTDRRFVSPG